MPEFRQFYKNCDCCSGSGSSTGSQPCDCTFTQTLCGSSPVFTNCKKNLVVNITLDFSGCVGTQMGSCGSGSGSSGSGLPVQSGVVDGEGSGSSGSSGSECRKTCKPCCDLAAFNYELNLECFGDYLSTGFIQDGCLPPPEGFACLESRDGCPYFEINSAGSGVFLSLFDDGYLSIVFSGATVASCNPFQIDGTLNGTATALGACLRTCLGDTENISPTCITGTFTITEALP